MSTDWQMLFAVRELPLDFMWWSIVEGSKSVEGKIRWKLDVFKSD